MNGKDWIQLALEALKILLAWGIEKAASDDGKKKP